MATIPHRHEKLCELLAELDRQMQPGAGARVCISPPVSAGGPSLGAKIQFLAQSSVASWVCTLDDDDWIAPGYVSRIMEALETDPDYVGFQVHYSADGGPAVVVDHSLVHGGWGEAGSIVRDISDLNPIRRTFALQGNYLGSLPGHPSGGHGNDRAWADSIRELGLVTNQAYIDEPLYFYRYSSSDNYVTPRGDVVAPQLPPYPWLKVSPYG